MNKEKIKNAFKNYGYYCLAFVMTVAIGVTIALASAKTATVSTDTSSAKNPVISVGAESLTFALPMENPEILKEYNGKDLMWNSTLAWWEAHEGVDLRSSNNKVYSIANGEVVEVTEDGFEGTKVTVKHSNGVKSVYSSLQNVKVKKGDTVKKGQYIGDASNSAGFESETGAHLHLSLIENDKFIDPNNYLDLGTK